MNEYLIAIGESIEAYGLFLIIPLLFIENIPFVGFIAPGVTVLFLSGFFYEILPLSLILLFFMCLITIFAADTLWFWLGRTGRNTTKIFVRIATRSPNVEELLKTQSPLALLFYQFPPYLRMFLPFSLGMYRFPVSHWLLVSFLASVVYTAVFFGSGVLTARLWNAVDGAATASHVLNSAIVVSVIIYTVYLGVRYIKISKNVYFKANE